MDRTFDVVTIGHAIVDVIASAPDELPAAHGMEKGSMTLVDAETADALYNDLGPASEFSGGSAANTAAGVAALGGTAAFMGKVRDDLLGRVFTHDITAAGVEFLTPPATSGPPTGRSMIMVTPDAERTFATYLGAGGFLSPEDIDHKPLISAGVVYVEGYMVGLRETEWTVNKAAAAAHALNGQFALSLSDPTWVEEHAAAFGALLQDVDILFCNEDEVKVFSGEDELPAALSELATRLDILVVTRGAEGSVVVSNRQRIDVPAHPVDVVVDTTGAGDLYAAGFLYGLTHDLELEACARLGGLAAAEVISHFGARPQASLTKLAAEAGLLG
jgi:sugar/nucleoside kinase (ribokinase family)